MDRRAECVRLPHGDSFGIFFKGYTASLGLRRALQHVRGHFAVCLYASWMHVAASCIVWPQHEQSAPLAVQRFRGPERPGLPVSFDILLAVRLFDLVRSVVTSLGLRSCCVIDCLANLVSHRDDEQLRDWFAEDTF